MLDVWAQFECKQTVAHFIKEAVSCGGTLDAIAAKWDRS